MRQIWQDGARLSRARFFRVPGPHRGAAPRLTLLNNERTVQNDISDVTDEAITRIKVLVAEHAKQSQSRPGLRLPLGDQ